MFTNHVLTDASREADDTDVSEPPVRGRSIMQGATGGGDEPMQLDAGEQQEASGEQEVRTRQSGMKRWRTREVTPVPLTPPPSGPRRKQPARRVKSRSEY